MNLFDTVIRLRDGGVARPSPRASLADTGSPDRWIVAAFRAETDADVHPDVWERHPCGQEVLCVLSGTMNVYLRDPDAGAEPTATVTAGESFIIPAGRWHRLSVVEPAELLAITAPAGTVHEPVVGMSIA